MKRNVYNKGENPVGCTSSFFMTDVQSSFVCHKKEKVQDYAEEPILQFLPLNGGGGLAVVTGP